MFKLPAETVPRDPSRAVSPAEPVKAPVTERSAATEENDTPQMGTP